MEKARTSDRFTGIVLAGGESRRMEGVDKTVLDFQGRPLIRRVIDAITPMVSSVVIASGRANRLEGYGDYQQVEDGVAGVGPLAGIRAGLAAARTEWAFVVAADMPYVQAPLIERILDLCAPGCEAVIPRIGDKLEPLHAAYRVDLITRIDEAIARGARKVTTAIEGASIHWLDLDEATSRAFFNVNYPGDL